MRTASGPLVIASLVAALVAPATVCPLAAQPPLLSRADSVAQAGDTAGALDLLDRAVRQEPRSAAAWHRRGMLAWAKARPTRRAEGVVKQRGSIALLRAADSSLRMAAQLAPDSGRYALDLARYFLFANVITMRTQAPGRFERALGAARRAADSALAAEALDEIGMLAWRRYEAVADRYLFRPGRDRLPAFQPNDRRAVKDFIDLYTVPYTEPSGQLDYLKAAEMFAAALRADPSNVRAVRHAFMALAEQERWEELRHAANARLAAAPSDTWAWLALGLAAHRADDAPAAAAAFDSALARLAPAERTRLTRITRILRPADSAAYERQPPPERAEFERMYWAVADPLALTPENEHWLEFLARVAYAELRWTSDDFDVRGADSDRGDVWVRYGPPPVKMSFPRTQLLWYYPAENIHFVFNAPPTYGTAHMPVRFLEVAERLRAEGPVSWSSVPVSRTMDSVAVQVARFRAPGDSSDVVIYADVPVRRLVGSIDVTSGPVEMAFTLYESRARALGRDSTRDVVDFADPRAAQRRSWRQRLPPGGFAYRVEAYQPTAGRAARAFGTAVVAAARGFGISDVAVADRVAPRGEATPERWSDLFVTPSAGELRKGQTFGVMWESYELAARNGVSRYRVELELTVLEIARPAHLLARIVGGAADALGVTAKGDNQVSLSYTRERPAAPALLDYLTVELGDAPAGRYRLAVRVTDLETGRSAGTERGLLIVP